MRKVISLPMLGGGAVFVALAIAMYHNAAAYLLGRWGRDDFTYCYFIPLVVAYMVWEKRAELACYRSCRSWGGLLPALLGIILYWLGELGGEFTVMFLSLWLLSIGAFWSLLGLRKLRVIGFPLLFSLAMIPPPNALYNSLNLRLKLISSQIGVLLLQLGGMSAYREGNVIDLGFTRLQVVDACSGLRYFFPLIVLGILLACFFKGPLWKKVVIVLTAIPVSIVTNSMRIASVGVLYQFMGPAAAEGFFHDFSGWFIFMVSLGILVLVMLLLKRFFPEAKNNSRMAAAERCDSAPSDGGFQLRSAPQRLISPQFALILLLMVATTAGVTVHGVSLPERVALQQPFSRFPDTIGNWISKRQTMEKIFLDELGLNDYLLADFHNGRGELISCYVGFNDSQSKGKATHSPASCLPGSGWELQHQERIAVQDGSGRTITVNSATMAMGSDRQLIYFWFDQRGRILTDLYQIKLYNFLDAVTQGRTDGALVRLITPLAAGETTTRADARLRAFVAALYPQLKQFLPAGMNRTAGQGNS